MDSRHRILAARLLDGLDEQADAANLFRRWGEDPRLSMKWRAEAIRLLWLMGEERRAAADLLRGWAEDPRWT